MFLSSWEDQSSFKFGLNDSWLEKNCTCNNLARASCLLCLAPCEGEPPVRVNSMVYCN